MEITVTIKAPDLAAAIQSLADAIVASGCIPVDVQPVKDIKITQEMVESLQLDKVPVSAEEPSKDEKSVKEDAKVYTLEEVRALFVAKNSAANRDKLKKLLTEFKVKKVTDLQEEDFAAVVAKLEAM